jgi:hypothetical protein
MAHLPEYLLSCLAIGVLVYAVQYIGVQIGFFDVVACAALYRAICNKGDS